MAKLCNNTVLQRTVVTSKTSSRMDKIEPALYCSVGLEGLPVLGMNLKNVLGPIVSWH